MDHCEPNHANDTSTSLPVTTVMSMPLALNTLLQRLLLAGEHRGDSDGCFTLLAHSLPYQLYFRAFILNQSKLPPLDTLPFIWGSVLWVLEAVSIVVRVIGCEQEANFDSLSRKWIYYKWGNGHSHQHWVLDTIVDMTTSETLWHLIFRTLLCQEFSPGGHMLKYCTDKYD